MRRVLLAVVGICYSFTCLAALRAQSVDQFCTALNDTQLRAGEWSSYGDSLEGCKSGPRLTGTGPVDDNKISYAVEGVGRVATRVKLTLQLTLPSDDNAAKRELIRATKRLSVRALGLSIPHSFDEAIMRASPINLAVGTGRAILTKTAVDKRSYVLSVIME